MSTPIGYWMRDHITGQCLGYVHGVPVNLGFDPRWVPLYDDPTPVAPADPVVPTGWKVESVPPWSALTDEANADRRWLVTRTEAPRDASADERWLLAAHVGIPCAYMDDGEAQGQQHGISFDFMREPVTDIDAKLRALAVAPVPQPLTDAQLDALRQGESRLNFVTLREFRTIAMVVERALGITGDQK